MSRAVDCRPRASRSHPVQRALPARGCSRRASCCAQSRGSQRRCWPRQAQLHSSSGCRWTRTTTTRSRVRVLRRRTMRTPTSTQSTPSGYPSRKSRGSHEDYPSESRECALKIGPEPLGVGAHAGGVLQIARRVAGHPDPIVQDELAAAKGSLDHGATHRLDPLREVREDPRPVVDGGQQLLGHRSKPVPLHWLTEIVRTHEGQSIGPEAGYQILVTLGLVDRPDVEYVDVAWQAERPEPRRIDLRSAVDDALGQGNTDHRLDQTPMHWRHEDRYPRLSVDPICEVA